MNIYHQPVVATHIYDRGDCYIYRASISFHAPPYLRNAPLPS